MVNHIFLKMCLFSWRTWSMRAGSESQIPQRAGCVFWQQWKRKTQPHMCLCAENVAGSGSISEVSQLAAVNVCLVFFSPVSCLLFLSDPFGLFIHSVYLLIYIHFMSWFSCMQLSLSCFHSFCITWPFYSSSAMFFLFYDFASHWLLLLSGRMTLCAQSAEVLHWAPHLSCCFWC